MLIKKLCTLGKFPTYIEFRQLDEAYKRYDVDEEFRKEVDSFWNKSHPAVVTIVR